MTAMTLSTLAVSRKEVNMKISRGFIVAIELLFALMVLVEVKMPKQFNWEERTYAFSDPNPFGAKLVDSILEASMNGRYEVRRGTIYNAFNDSDSTNLSNAVLLVDHVLYDYDDDEIEWFLEIMRRGQYVIFISDYLPDSLGLLLDVSIDSGYDAYGYNNYFTEADSTTLIWDDDNTYDKMRYRFRIFDPYNSGIIADFYNDSAKWNPILKQKLRITSDIVVAANRDYGKGKLFLISWPQVFTNYNVLEPGGANLLMRLMSQVGNKHVVRYDFRETDSYKEDVHESTSPLRVFLDNRSLRWAVYLALITILLSLIFTARRRQRVIPVIEPPANSTLNMVKHIGLMHYRHHDNTSLVLDRYKQFSQELMQKLLVDVTSDDEINENISYISKRTGIDGNLIVSAISRLRQLAGDYNIRDSKLTDSEAKSLIDIMNNIINNL